MYQEHPRRSSQRGDPRANVYFQDNHNQRASYRRDFIQLNNLPNNVRLAESPESYSSLVEEAENDQTLLRNDPTQFAVLDNELPSHVKQTRPNIHSTYAQLQSSLPRHVKPAAVPQRASQFAAPSQNFNAMGYKTAMPLERKRERSCFGLCLCSGKSCVIFTTAVSLLLALALFFLWMRRPGFIPASEIIFKDEPLSLSNDTMSIFHTEIMYSIRISNPNFYPLRLVRMPAKVYDSATGSIIGAGELTNVNVPALGKTYANLTLVLDFRVGNPQDRTWQNIEAACPTSPNTDARVPLTTRTQTSAYFNMFQWAGFIPRDSLQRNLVCI